MAWLGIQDAMSALGCSERTVYRRIRDGRLSVHRDNGSVLVEVDEQGDTVSEAVGQMARVATAGAPLLFAIAWRRAWRN